MHWQVVNNDDESTLPPIDQVVFVIYLSGFYDAPVIAFGGRVDDPEGWLWAVDECNGYRINQEWNALTADDDYRVTHWAAIEWPSA